MKNDPVVKESEHSVTLGTALSPIVHLLGDLLGEVIKEQAGMEKFEIVEKIRLTSKRIRENDDATAEKELMDIIGSLSHEQQLTVIKAFSIYFQLNNLAEEWYRIKKNKYWDASHDDPRTDTFKAVIRKIKEQGVSLNDFLDLLKDVHLKPVWTAHPTEARRLTTLMTLHEIFTLVDQLQTESTSPIEQHLLRNRLKEKVTILWQSDDFRHVKPTVLDEVRSALYYFDSSVLDIIPELYRILKTVILTEYQDQSDQNQVIDLPPFLTFGSWVGGDRDGHPGVTSHITMQALLLHKRTCLRKYLARINELLKDFSMSLNNVGITGELQRSIEADEKIFPEFAAISKRLNPNEPYRRKLDFIRLKIENSLEKVEELAVQVGLGRTLVGSKPVPQLDPRMGQHYRQPSELLEDLLIIRESLLTHQGRAIAEGKLEDLIVLVRTCGFHLATLDIRQDSSVHEKALDEIFQKVELPSLMGLNESEKTQLLLSELRNARPLGVDQYLDELSPMTREIIETLHVIREALIHIDNHCVQSYIISMCRTMSDILILMLLMKETKLVKVEKGKIVTAAVDIVPLFETKADLERAPIVMDSLFSNGLYVSFLQQRNNTQEIMVGYSDSGKDVGYLESHYRIITAQLQLRQVAQRHGIKLRIFHGRGGTISRGGGPTNKALLAQPRGLVSDVKVTEQGEVIAANYGNPLIARRYLEQISSAVIQRSVADFFWQQQGKAPSSIDAIDPSEETLRTFESLSALAREKYESLVKQHPHFIEFFLNYTPIDLIERATIGSRPSRRKKTSVTDITALRAIPWVFSWMQCRLLVPAFFGVGTALQAFREQKALEKIKEMSEQWEYFSTLMDNLHMVLLKTDLIAAKRYLSLIRDQPHLEQLFEEIVDEYQLTRELVLKVTGAKELLELSPDLQQSIRRRNPYLDPLNACQVTILRKWRELGRPDELHPTSLLRALFQTVNGIAAGMRNTG